MPLQQEQFKPLIAFNHYKTYQPEYAEKTFGARGQDLPSVAIEAQLGDLVFFHHSMYHAVFNHQPDRRLLAYWFVGFPDTPQRLASLWRNDVTFTASWRRNGETWRGPPGMATSVLLDHPNPEVRSLMVCRPRCGNAGGRRATRKPTGRWRFRTPRSQCINPAI